MARQKSLRKRLSSYNKHSVGSAVLDSDTDIIGDEQPLWWEKLGNNTIVRPSMNSNMLNETSCQLDTNSEIESNLAVTDGWWKVLETSNVLNSLKMNKSRMLEKDTANNNTSTSESEEEEPRIAKRMFPPLIRKRKSEGNVFLNVLNDSKIGSMTEPMQPQNTNVEKSNVMQENSLNHSENATDILKVRSNVLRKNPKNRIKNAFADVLSENEVGIGSKKKSSIMCSNNESQAHPNEHVTPTAVLNQTKSSRFALSFENESDLSRFVPPKAQSTMLDGSTLSRSGSVKESNNSNNNTVHEIVKPKSKFLKSYHKNVKRNLLRNVFEHQETTEKEERSILMKRNSIAVDKTPKRSFRSSRISHGLTKDDVDEHEHGDDHAISSAQKIVEVTKKNLVYEDSAVSSDTSDSNENMKKVLKLKSRFVMRSRKDREKNYFQDIVEERDDNSRRSSSESKRLLNRAVERNSTVKYTTSAEEEGKRDESDEDSMDEMSLILKLPALSDENDITIREENDRADLKEKDVTLGKKRKSEDPILSTNQSEPSDVQDISKKRHQHLRMLENQPVARNREVSEVERIDNVRAKRSRKLRDVQEPSTIPVTTLERISDGETNDRGRSEMHCTFTYVTSESEFEGDESSRRRKLRSQDKAQTSSAVEECDLLTDVQQNVSKRQRSGCSSRSQDMVAVKHIEPEEGENIVSKRDISGQKSRKEENSVVKRGKETDSTEIDDSRNKSSDRLRRSERLVSARDSMKVKFDGGNGSLKRNSGRSSRMVEESVAGNVENHESVRLQDIPRPGSKSYTEVLRRLELSSTSKFESDEIESSPERGKKEPSMMQLRSVSKTVNESDSANIRENIETSKRQSDRLTPLKDRSVSSNVEKTKIDVQTRINERLRGLSDAVYKSKRSNVRSNSSVYEGKKDEQSASDRKKGGANKVIGDALSVAGEVDGGSNAERIDTDVNIVERVASISASLASSSKKKKAAAIRDRSSGKGKALTTSMTKAGINVGSSNEISKGQKSIRNFFKSDRLLLPASQVLCDEEKAKEMKKEVEKLIEWEMGCTKTGGGNSDQAKLSTRKNEAKKSGRNVKPGLKVQRSARQMHKAFLVNGQLYKVPRLPRPQSWITNRLYNHLWKRLEPRYKLETRVVSERFVIELSNVTSFITKRKSYSHYKDRLYALMKEMARLRIIRTRNDFYHFCYDFLPYELRIKMVPILLPGNKKNIPYNADQLHESLLDPRTVN